MVKDAWFGIRGQHRSSAVGCERMVARVDVLLWHVTGRGGGRAIDGYAQYITLRSHMAAARAAVTRL